MTRSRVFSFGRYGRRLPLAMSVVALVVAGAGTAVATNGRPAVLGGSNHSSRTTTLRDSHGTPLTLVGRHGKPPLTVGHDTVTVPSLNAALLGGLPAASYGGNLTVLSHPGTFTVTVPKGFARALVTAVGGGGGGGTNSSTATSGGSGSGGQGGAGVVVLPVSAGERLTVVVGHGGAVGSDGTLSSVRPSSVPATEWAVEALPGTAGGSVQTCPSLAQPGNGGAVVGPTAEVVPLGAVGIRATPGVAGLTGRCGGGDAFAAAGGGGHHVAGSGGSGIDGTGLTLAADQPGRPGVVTLEFLSS